MGNPFGNDAILVGIFREPEPPFVRNGSRRLGEHQAATGIVGNHATSLRLTRQRKEIVFGIVAAKRKFESILAGSGSMAGSAVTAGFGEHRLHVVAKAP